MANQKEIRVKIASTKKTMKITSAMKLVAAAKVNKMQKILSQARPYGAKVKEMFASLEASLSEDQKNSIPLLASRNKIESVLLVIISSDRGLCGAYNTNIIKAAARRIDELVAQGKKVKLITVGRKAKTAFQRDSYSNQGIEIVETFVNLSSLPNTAESSLVAEKAMETYLSGSVDKVEVVSTKFISLVASKVQSTSYLPIEKQAVGTSSKEQSDTDVLLEPSAAALVDTLLPMYTQNLIYQSFLESTTSELAARMTAMSNATKNAKDFIKKLVLIYNKARQASITQEISEIVGGAAALE